jgi:LPS-assembly lipoprotein
MRPLIPGLRPRPAALHRVGRSPARTCAGAFFEFPAHPSSLILLAATALLVAACGFQLRGTATLPFSTLYVQAAPTSQFATDLRRAVRSGSGTRIAERPEQAEVVLHILSELQEKQILSLTGGGRVSEYQLRYRVSFRLTDSKNREHIPASEIVLRRDYSYNDSQALGAESEEALLYRDMRSDAVSQMVRRLQAAKLKS